MAGEKAQYKTQQREALLKYLKANPGRHLTAADIDTYMKAQGFKIGTTTIYRQLEKLVDEGTLTKYVTGAGTPACFEYSRQESSPFVFHCKCERCGTLFHVKCEELEGIEEHLRKEHQFYLNPRRTVFYGVCGNCAKTGA